MEDDLGEIEDRPPEPTDLFIAAHAMALDCVLVTDNEREVARIDGPAVESWLRRGARAI